MPPPATPRLLPHFCVTALAAAVLLGTACRREPGTAPPAEPSFTLTERRVETDTPVTAAVFFQGRLLCRRTDDRLMVLDTAFRRVDSLERRLRGIRTPLLLSTDDTVWLFTGGRLQYLDRTLTVHPDRKRAVPLAPRVYGLYADWDFYVYECGSGEFGSTVYFLDRHTGRSWCYPCTGAQQAFRYRGTYVVCNYLPHGLGLSDYLFITDPTRLLPFVLDTLQFRCNPYPQRYDTFSDSALPAGVRYYRRNDLKYLPRLLLTFPRNGRLYSICSTDSLVILARFGRGGLEPVDTLLHEDLEPGFAKPQLAGAVALAVYGLAERWSRPGSGRGEGGGLLVVRGTRIDLVRFVRPGGGRR